MLKIGTANGTKINEPDYPGEDNSNAARDRWMMEWSVISEALIASTAKKAAEGREKKAKDRLKSVFSDTIASLKPGDKMTLARGNVSVLLDVRSGQSSPSKEAIITILRTEYKWDQEEVMVFIDKITKIGEPKLYTTFSSTQE